MGNLGNKISTKTQPILFFEDFFGSTVVIDELRENFFPDPNDPDNYWSNRLTSNIDRENESFDADYEKVVEWEAIEDVPGHPISIPMKTEWRVEKKEFKSYLDNILYREVQISKECITESFETITTDKYKKRKIKNWLGELLHFLTLSKTSNSYSTYQPCSISTASLIRYFYILHPLFCPRPSEEIDAVIFDKSLPVINFEKERVLRYSFFTAVEKEYVESDGGNNEVFLLQEMESFRDIFYLITSGQIGKLSKINFLWPTDAVVYLLSSIKPYCSADYSINEILDNSNITFRGKRISRNRFDTAKSRYSKQNPPTRLKKRIDALIADHSSILE